MRGTRRMRGRRKSRRGDKRMWSTWMKGRARAGKEGRAGAREEERAGEGQGEQQYEE